VAIPGDFAEPPMEEVPTKSRVAVRGVGSAGRTRVFVAAVVVTIEVLLRNLFLIWFAYLAERGMWRAG
jgi:hypothetical protein